MIIKLRIGVFFVALASCFSVLANTQQHSLNNSQQNPTKFKNSTQIEKDNVKPSNDIIDHIDLTLNHQATNFNNSSLADINFFNEGQINSPQWFHQQNQILSSNVKQWYLPQADNLVHIEKIRYQNTLTSSAQYNNGIFSAKTGFFSDNSTPINNNIFYLQSSLIVLNSHPFNLAVAARFDEQQVNYVNFNGTVFDKPIYTSTLGIIGTYALNKNWYVSGAITATSVNEKFINGQVADQNQYNQAVIGTTYSF